MIIPPVLVGLLGAIYFSGPNCIPTRSIPKVVITEDSGLTLQI